jgi:hypothetical protein
MSQFNLPDLLNSYIEYRRNEANPEQALKAVAKANPGLGPEDRQKLMQLIRQWEVRRDEPVTQPRPAEFDMQNLRPAALDKPKATQDGLACRQCGKPNPIEAKFCYACGHLLGDSRETGVLIPDDLEDPAVFGNLATLVITVEGFEDQPLRTRVLDAPLIIGRSEIGSKVPGIDLGAYGAKEAGVSRQHAILKRVQQTLTIIDEGSVNSTFVNGEKLHPQEVRVVRDGDEIRFAKLVTYFKFHREVRRLT